MSLQEWPKEAIVSTYQDLINSQLETINLLEFQRGRFFDTMRAIAVDGLGFTDPWAEDAPGAPPKDWTKFPTLSEAVKAYREGYERAENDLNLKSARLEEALENYETITRACRYWRERAEEARSTAPLAELRKLATWVRAMEYNRDDAPDEIARAIENRIRALEKEQDNGKTIHQTDVPTLQP